MAAAASGCGDGPRSTAETASPTPPAVDVEPVATPTVDPSIEAALSRPRVMRLLSRCPVTKANHDIPQGQEGNPAAALADYHGEGRLWTGLPPRGILVPDRSEVRRDGSISRKFPWWRGVEGDLKITGSRIGRVAAPVRARIPDGYDPSGFQASAIVFAGEGCWRVVGSAGTEQLTFVTLVVKAVPG